ncbi:hypothetical protein B0H11DRAFT_1162076 [Mycena galericulata]|nr:hypothetical protein B0H11DRAFT_1162076 [Mycena galericulata]
MSLSETQADLLLQLAVDVQATAYVAVAALTVLVFDWLVSLDREVEMVWKRPKSLVKWLYIWNRYFALSMTCFCTSVYLRRTPSNLESCFISQQIQGTGATIIVGTVDIILLLRVWILYERSTRLMYTLLAMIIAEVTTMLSITTCAVNGLNEYVHVGFIVGCYASQEVPRYFSIFPVPSLIVSFSMFCLTVHNCQRRIAVSRSYHTHSIVVVFLRDGVLWLLAVVVVNPPQIFMWAFGRASLIQLLMMCAIQL